MESVSNDEGPRERKSIDPYLEKDNARYTQRLIEAVRNQIGDVAAANLESILFEPTLDPDTRIPAKKQERIIGLNATEISLIKDLARQHNVLLPKIFEDH